MYWLIYLFRVNLCKIAIMSSNVCETSAQDLFVRKYNLDWLRRKLDCFVYGKNGAVWCAILIIMQISTCAVGILCLPSHHKTFKRDPWKLWNLISARSLCIKKISDKFDFQVCNQLTFLTYRCLKRNLFILLVDVDVMLCIWYRDIMGKNELKVIQFNLGLVYSDDSLIQAQTVRKSHLSGQKVREPISFSGLMGVSVIRKTR